MDDVLFAHTHDGQPLTPNHGWPLRLVVPHLYFWEECEVGARHRVRGGRRCGLLGGTGLPPLCRSVGGDGYRDDPEWNEGEKNTDEYYERVARRIRLHEQKKAAQQGSQSE